MTFEEVMQFTRTIGQEVAFNDDACQALYDAAITLPEHSNIMEIGVQYGRSTSILAQIAKAKNHRLLLVDPFLSYDGKDWLYVAEWLHKLKVPFIHWHGTSDSLPIEELFFGYDFGIDLLHIDGDHTVTGVTLDGSYLNNVNWNGYACFHDYGRPDPDIAVKQVVDRYLASSSASRNWERVAEAGTLLVLRRTA